MITAHPLVQVHLIAPQLLLWMALPHHADIMLATNYLSCRCYSVPFGQHAVHDETTDYSVVSASRLFLNFSFCTEPTMLLQTGRSTSAFVPNMKMAMTVM